MGVQMTELTGGEATCEFVYNGKVIHLTYDPNAYTAQLEGQWRVLSEQVWAGDMGAQFVCDLLTGWDLLGDVEFSMIEPTEDELYENPDAQPRLIPGTGRVVPADHPFPIEFEKVRVLPMPFLGEVVDAIRDDLAVGKQKRRRSGAGSGTGAIRPIR